MYGLIAAGLIAEPFVFTVSPDVAYPLLCSCAFLAWSTGRLRWPSWTLPPWYRELRRNPTTDDRYKTGSDWNAEADAMYLSIPLLIEGAAVVAIGAFLLVSAESIQVHALNRAWPAWGEPLWRFVRRYLLWPSAYVTSLRFIGAGGVVLGLVIIYLAFQAP